MLLFKKIACAGKYQDDQAIPDVISYIMRADKIPSGVIGGVQVDMNHIADSMISVSKHFRKYNKVRLHHFIVSFGKEDIFLPNMLRQIAEEICAFIGKQFQIIYALHEDMDHPHIHFVFNAVSYVDGKKYHCGISEYYQLFYCIETILKSFHLSPLIHVNYRPKPDNPHE